MTQITRKLNPRTLCTSMIALLLVGLVVAIPSCQATQATITYNSLYTPGHPTAVYLSHNFSGSWTTVSMPKITTNVYTYTYTGNLASGTTYQFNIKVDATGSNFPPASPHTEWTA